MNLPTDPLDLAILLHREMRQRVVVDGRNIEGELPGSYDFDAVISLLERHDMRVTEASAHRRLEFSPPPSFHQTMEALLTAVSRRIQPQARFYIADIDCVYPFTGQEPNKQIQSYLNSSALFRSLQSVADHLSQMGSATTLVFLQQQKLEITSVYSVEDLAILPELDNFTANFIESSTHKQQKETILRTVLFELFSNQKKINFSDILKNFSSIADNLHSSYQLYVSEFSFLKVKSEIEKEKLEFTTKLNKVFSDIQNQLLAVPAALILIGGQMEKSDGPSMKNIFIWVGSLIFAFLMNLLINNQRHTLKAIKTEIDQQWKLIEGKHKKVAEQFKGSYAQLDARYRHQRTLLWTVDAMVGAALIFATGMFIWYADPDKLSTAAKNGALIGSAIYLAYEALLWVIRRFRR